MQKPEAGATLKKIRQRLGLRMRDVQEASQKIVESQQDESFFLSTPRLTQIENDPTVPSIHKLYALSVIYRITYGDLLRLYGIELDAASHHAALLPPLRLRESHLEVYDKEQVLTFPIRLDPSFDAHTTQSLSHLVEIWGEVPLGFFQRLQPMNYHYGFIGLGDYMMDPLIRPGAIVTIDTERDKIQPSEWRTEFDRPIYFVELHQGYRCAWCEMTRPNALTLVPYPLSPCQTETLAFPDKAEIVGQVIAVAMRLLPPAEKKITKGSRRRALP